MGVTPVYGIRYPDAATKFADLGSGLANMGDDIENALVQGSQAAPVYMPWTPIPLPGDWTYVTPAPAVMRLGLHVVFRGVPQYSAGITTNMTFVNISSLVDPPPAYVRTTGACSDSTNASRRLNIDTSGNILLNGSGSGTITWQSLDDLDYWLEPTQ